MPPVQSRAPEGVSAAEIGALRVAFRSGKADQKVTVDQIYRYYSGNGYLLPKADNARRAAAGRMYRRLVAKGLVDVESSALTAHGEEMARV